MSNYIINVRKTAEFKEIFSQGKRINGKFFSLFYIDKHHDETFALGVVTRKKLSKKATQRNYLKRIIKEYVRTQAEPLKNGKKAVFLLKSDMKKIKKQEIAKTTRKDLSQLLTKAELFV